MEGTIIISCFSGQQLLDFSTKGEVDRALVALPDFKSGVPGEQPGWWVRFPCTSATISPAYKFPLPTICSPSGILSVLFLYHSSTGRRKRMSEISITNRTLGALQPQPKPYFLRDNNPKGFAVKVNPSGKILFIAEGRHKGATRREPPGYRPVLQVAETRTEDWRSSVPIEGIGGGRTHCEGACESFQDDRRRSQSTKKAASSAGKNQEALEHEVYLKSVSRALLPAWTSIRVCWVGSIPRAPATYSVANPVRASLSPSGSMGNPISCRCSR